MKESYRLSLTTQGPLYPPSEVMDNAGNFIVIGAINRPDDAGGTSPRWGSAIVSANSPVPEFGSLAPYSIVQEFDDQLPDHLADKVLYTLPLPLPCSNYPMVFAPEQYPDANVEIRPSYPFHQTPIPDAAPEHGRKMTEPITLGDWMRAEGTLWVTSSDDGRSAVFEFEFSGLVPDSLYTVMTLRARDLDPAGANTARPARRTERVHLRQGWQRTVSGYATQPVSARRVAVRQ